MTSLSPPRAGERILFVTGRLAETALQREVAALAQTFEIRADVVVLGISVAALMHVDWIVRKLHVPADVDRVVLPGWCQGDIRLLDRHYGKPFELGPKDLRDLPEALGAARTAPPDLSTWDIEIIAEINQAPQMSDRQIVELAQAYRRNGADVIDLGCVPGANWPHAGHATRLLRSEGLRVSIDSFDRHEVEAAVEAGAELVLSCNAANRDWAADLPAELVAIPDDPRNLSSLDATIDKLRDRRARFRIDPILEPIGFGFAASLGRYHEARLRWPDTAMLMGIGNLTELTEVDSAGINLLLAGFCQEMQIRSVLTTEVANWCRTAVREFDVARRLAHHAVRSAALPKHLGSPLPMLRDARVRALGNEELARLAAQIRDPNFRLFAEGGQLHAINREGHRSASDPFDLFAQMGAVDAPHAFYLGFELAKALTALTLGKNYVQDRPLDWGFLTRDEPGAHDRRQSGENPDLHAASTPEL